MKLNKISTLIILFSLVGFTTLDQESYMVIYDKTKENPEVIFEKIEKYVASNGFHLEQKIAESLPEKKIVSNYKMYQGGVFLNLTLKSNEIILIDGVRPRGGCSKQERISEMIKLKNDLLVHLNEASTSKIELEER